MFLIQTYALRRHRYYWQWVLHPSLKKLKELLHAWDWDDMDGVIKRVSLELSNQRYSKRQNIKFDIFFSDIDQTHQIHQLVNLISVECCETLFHQIKAPFAMRDDDYFRFQISEKILHIIKQAKNTSDPGQFITFMLSQTRLELQSFKEPRVICIEPESLCKFPTHSIWMLGFASETWRRQLPSRYLSTDTIQSDKEPNAIRIAFGAWALESPQLIGASFSSQINDLQNHPIDTIKTTIESIPRLISKQKQFVRQPLGQLKATQSLALSPSSLQLYQRCPYAFYLKQMIKISTQDPPADYQVFGTIIHELIEKIAKKEITDQMGVSIFLKQRLNPLMAKMMETKILNEWSIEDIVSWIQSFQGNILTEYELNETIQNIQLKGRADLIFMDETSVEVIDIKSGKLPTKKDIGRYDYIQLGVYLLLIEKVFKTPNMKASLIAKDQHFSTPIDSNNDAFSEHMSGLKTHIFKLVDLISSGKFDPTDAVSDARLMQQQCRVCEFYHICHFRERHHR